MCLGGRQRVTQLPPLPQPVEAPPPPAPATISAPPTLARLPEEKNPQKRAKTYASRRRAAAGGISGKRRFTIPLNMGGGGGTNY